MVDARRSSSSGGQLRLAALGPLEAYHGATPIDLGPPKQRAVLALLAVHRNSPVTVDRMIDELWGEEPPATALATLQAYVSNLRRALEPGRRPRQEATALVSRTGAYELVVADDHVDIGLFEAGFKTGMALVDDDPAAAAAAFGEALALWRGPALAEFSAYGFAIAEAHRLDELRLGATEQWIAAELHVRPTSALVADLEHLVGQHPLHERFWQHLMRAYYLTGRQADALRAYRRCEESLVDELGISPSAEIRALEQAILAQDPSLLASHRAPSPVEAEPTSPSSPAQGMVGRTAEHSSPARGIVGRTAEQACFVEALGRADRGHGTVMLISGPPGIGKTRLTEALLDTARERGCAVAMARCVEVGGSPPFWPWIQIARALGLDTVLDAAGPFVDHLAPFFPEAEHRSAERSSAEASHRLAEALVHVVHRLAVDRPVVLLVDDLYSADPDSLSVLTLVASAIESERVVIVGTHRGSMRAPDRQLTDILVQLSRFEWVERHRLEPLDLCEVGELVTSVAGCAVDDETIRTIHDRSDGNAFFATELARLVGAGRHTLAAPATRVPETVREVIDRRLSSLSPDAMQLVRVAAVIGRTFDLSIVAAVAGREMDELIELADLALAMGLAEEADRPGRFRFAHLLMVDSVLSGVGTLRRAQLHHRVAEAIEAQYGSDPDRWDDLAHHRVEAVPVAGVEPAIAALARAGRRAASIHAFELAERHFEQRHALVLSKPPSTERDEEELESIFDQAVVWTWRDGYQACRVREATDRMLQLTDASNHEAMVDPTTETGLRHGVLAALQARNSFEIVSGDVEASAATSAIMVKLAGLVGDPYVEAIGRVNAAIASLHAGRLCEAAVHVDRVDELLDLVDPGRTGEVTLPLGQQSLAVTHFCFAGWLRWLQGDAAAAAATFEEGHRIADQCGHQFSRAFLTAIECISAVCADDAAAATASLAWGAPEGRHLFGFLDTLNDLYRVWARGRREEDPAAAAAALLELVAGLDGQGARVVQTLHWGMISGLHLAAASPAEALDCARRGIELATANGERFWLSELHRLEAEALALLARSGAAEALALAMDAAAGMRSPPLIARIEEARQRLIAAGHAA